MKQYHRLAALGALLMALSLVGYAVYELVLYPGAGFPTSDYSVIIAGADTLRVGHWLKFGYAISLSLVVVGLYPRMIENSPALARLAAITGTGAIILFAASGKLGLRILQIAGEVFATDPSQAVTTILLRTVTVSLFETAIFAVGWYLLLLGLAGVQAGVLPRATALIGMALGVLYLIDPVLPDTLQLVAPLASIPWALWLAFILYN
jgi:hypothetical protein